MRRFWCSLTCAVLLIALQVRSEEHVLTLDASKSIGEIRALHGGNSGPLCLGDTVDLSAFHREIGIPYTRLHDCHWPNPDVVDIHVIFPDFKADPAKPESYDFRHTDQYLESVVKTGAKIVYRLGESIEHTQIKYHVHPPQDFDKWTAICEGIIKHYNEGWANGFKYGIQHWEIWNEPENQPAMWTGTDAQYFSLYVTAAKKLKARFPELQFGGPALGYTGQVVNGKYKPPEFLLKMLAECKKVGAPLDFFSWHLYTNDPTQYANRAKELRALLDAQGFEKTDMHLNEWNYLPNNDWSPMLGKGQGVAREKFYGEMGGPAGAAFTSYTLCALQDTPVSIANYYSAEVQGFGMFNYHGTPKKTFYAFKAFKKLLDTPLRVSVSGEKPGKLNLFAGTNAEKSAVQVLVNYFQSVGDELKIKPASFPWNGETRYEVLAVDAQHDLTRVHSGVLDAGGIDLTLYLKAPAVGLIKFTPAK